jgi:hypothetical protein
MHAALEIHGTSPRNGAKSSALRHDRPVIDPQEAMERTPQILKLERRVIVHWSVTPPFHPAIESAIETDWPRPRAIAENGRAGVAKRINDTCTSPLMGSTIQIWE